ncbi:hypothetical protein L2U69_15635 [Zavarzinia compransoris]|uniref:DUF7662 domain-containing protein n=1 Tax=Zavarzinia marina TaxID=2911065 RepID=UPI001F2A4D38|nr:hypothetical protein [Zavarzinia marina]MCF4167085.1 hypothetical protein [Zavarzinia marina]
MDKYDPLRAWLRAGGSRLVTLSFDEIDHMVHGLPRTAFEREQWWSNDDDAPGDDAPGDDAPCHAWRDAGYLAHADRGRGLVAFTRAHPCGW